jgi:hypothetical protein
VACRSKGTADGASLHGPKVKTRLKTTTGSTRASVSTLGPTAIIQVRKGVETFVKERARRKVKITIGHVTVEGNAADIAKLVSSEQIKKCWKMGKASHE